MGVAYCWLAVEYSRRHIHIRNNLVGIALAFANPGLLETLTGKQKI